MTVAKFAVDGPSCRKEVTALLFVLYGRFDRVIMKYPFVTIVVRIVGYSHLVAALTCSLLEVIPIHRTDRELNFSSYSISYHYHQPQENTKSPLGRCTAVSYKPNAINTSGRGFVILL